MMVISRPVRVLLWLAIVAALLMAALSATTSAHASTTGGRKHAYNYAVNRIGCWYNWGAAGPCGNGYDCSGLVYAAYRSAGFAIPRTTYSMLGWWRLRRETRAAARPGDLVFFGSGHVELFRWAHVTLGAQQSGTPVDYHRWYAGSWYRPTGYYHVYGAG